MNIPEDTNTRAEAMWRIISQRIDFRQKRVIDLGCGHGEMLWRAYKAGATYVVGVEKDICELKEFYAVLPTLSAELTEGGICVCQANIDILLNTPAGDYNFDIGMCFSVLPYLSDTYALEWMAEAFPLCLIEAQYEPEPYNIGMSSDSGMYAFLRENGFKCATWLGETYVEIRDTHRSIWACSKGVVRL